MNYYMILFYKPDPENKPYGRTYQVLLVKAPSRFDAERKAEEELKKWNGWQMDDGAVHYLDAARIDAGEVVGLTAI